MKLTTPDINNLKTILTICDLVDISAAVVADGKISGINEAKNCVILSDKNVPALPAETRLGMSRLKTLKVRLDLFALDPQLDIELIEGSKNTEIAELILKGSKAKSSFRATASHLIKYPKSIADPVLRKVSFKKAEVKMLLDAGRAMSAQHITLSFKAENLVQVEFMDANKDNFVIVLDDASEVVGDGETSKIIHFPFDVFSALIRTAVADLEVVNFDICSASGIINVLGHDVRILSHTE